MGRERWYKRERDPARTRDLETVSEGVLEPIVEVPFAAAHDPLAATLSPFLLWRDSCVFF